MSDHSAPGPSRAPQLVRARSGPATLSHAVFEMLYVELRSVLGGLRKARMARARERVRSKAAEASNVRKTTAAAAAAATAAAVAPAVGAECTEGRDEEETEDASDRVEASSAVDGEAAAAPVVASAATDVTVSGKSGEGGEPPARVDDEEEREEEEKEVFDQLADMRDDLGCLKLSRELQVGRSPKGLYLVVEKRCKFVLDKSRWSIVSPGFVSAHECLDRHTRPV